MMNDQEKNEKDGFRISNVLTIVAGIAVAVFVAILGTMNITDLKEQRRAKETMDRLTELRIALEKYYQVTKTYPELSKEGACNDLKILDYYGPDGKLISFAEIYGKNQIVSTPENEKISENNTVRDTDDFKNGTKSGGWNYNYSGHTGEIHANLPYNIYSQQIEWGEY